MTSLARTAGTGIAAAALALAFAGARAQAFTPSGGLLPWVFAVFAAGALLAIFTIVLWTVREPRERRAAAEPPGAAGRRI